MSVLRLAWTALLCGAIGCGSSSSRPVDQGPSDQRKPHSDAGPPPGPTGEPSRFSFENGTDETSKALTSALIAFVTTPTVDTAAKLEQQRVDAAAALAKDPEGAATRVIDDLNALEKQNPADGSGVLLLMNLLGQIESTKGLTFLHDYALRVPPPAASGGAARGVVLWMRGVATDQLGRRLSAGSSAAKLHLLDLVEKAEPGVRAIAIRRFYEATPLRWKARRELSQKLKASDRYLLREIY